jgi:hypothetical protein
MNLVDLRRVNACQKEEKGLKTETFLDFKLFEFCEKFQ